MSCTLIIPTYNRPHFLSAQLHYLTSAQHGFPILVLDSSPSPVADENRDLCLAHSIVSYAHLPSETKVFDKFAQGLGSARTPYAVLIPDDDFLLLDHLPALLNALEDNPRAVSAHGFYFEFHETFGRLHLSSLIETGPTIDAPTPMARVHALMTRYEAITYAVHRVDAARRTFALAARQTAILAQELLQGTASAAKGAILRVPVLSHGRRSDSSLGYEAWHPMTWMAVDPIAMFSAYAGYREALREAVLAEPGSDDEAQTIRTIDLSHLSYLSQYLEAEVIDAVVALDPRKVGAEAVRAAALERFAQVHGPGWAHALRGHGRLSHWVRHTARTLGARQKIAALTNMAGRFIMPKSSVVRQRESGASGPSIAVTTRFQADCAKYCPAIDLDCELDLIARALPYLSMAGVNRHAPRKGQP